MHSNFIFSSHRIMLNISKHNWFAILHCRKGTFVFLRFLFFLSLSSGVREEVHTELVTEFFFIWIHTTNFWWRVLWEKCKNPRTGFNIPSFMGVTHPLLRTSLPSSHWYPNRSFYRLHSESHSRKKSDSLDIWKNRNKSYFVL